MPEENNLAPKRPSTLAYIIGGMSFIPLIGVLFGIISIIWGFATSKTGGKRIAFMGLAGICLTIVLYGALFYFGFVQRGGVYDDLRKKFAQSTLNSLIPTIEYYKIQHGQYPESLKELQQSLPKDSFTFVFDPSSPNIASGPKYFFYERVGKDHYYLRSVGPDGQPFTADDIVPALTPAEASKTGLLLERKADAPTP